MHAIYQKKKSIYIRLPNIWKRTSTCAPRAYTHAHQKKKKNGKVYTVYPIPLHVMNRIFKASNGCFCVSLCAYDTPFPHIYNREKDITLLGYRGARTSWAGAIGAAQPRRFMRQLAHDIIRIECNSTHTAKMCRKLYALVMGPHIRTRSY